MLELQNICYQVNDEDGDKEILRNVNLKIDDHFVVITGPNGGGKSTLAKMIAGIVRPTSGKILLDGEDITELSITERAKKGISFAFQQPVRFKGLTVMDLIRLAQAKRFLCRMHVTIYQKLVCVQKNILTESSTTVYPVER